MALRRALAGGLPLRWLIGAQYRRYRRVVKTSVLRYVLRHYIGFPRVDSEASCRPGSGLTAVEEPTGPARGPVGQGLSKSSLSAEQGCETHPKEEGFTLYQSTEAAITHSSGGSFTKTPVVCR